MKADRIQEIRARCEATTPGPWRVSGDINHCVFCDSDKRFSGTPLIANCGHLHHADTKEHVSEMQRNATFIAHAREDMPYLLAQLADAQTENANLKDLAIRGEEYRAKCSKCLAELDEKDAQLAESQRRERAAVHDLNIVMTACESRYACHVCADGDCAPDEPNCKPKWRGLRTTGEGDAK